MKSYQHIIIGFGKAGITLAANYPKKESQSPWLRNQKATMEGLVSTLRVFLPKPWSTVPVK